MRWLLLSVLLLAGARAALAIEAFQPTDIRVEGLQRVPVGTVLNYLPIRIGDEIDDQRVAEAIRSLYQTGFFQDVSLLRDGDVLVVEVVERPSIASIDIRGNEAVPEEDMLKSLADIGLAEGQVFNRFLLNDVEQELRRLYQSRGQYDTEVESTVSPLPRNRVGVRIDIRESEPATIREITFVGNDRFSDGQLADLFELGPTRWYHFFSSRDEYAREKLAADLERLRSFYQNRGFLNFAITSTQVAMSPDRQGIYITVNVAEGEQYRVGEQRLAGDLVVGEEVLRTLLAVTPGQLYSREALQRSVDAIRDRLGEEGYAFANINIVPEVDEAAREVDLTYFVDPGKRVFVRRINISGNARTQDEVIRRELRQAEGGWLSTAAVKRSRERLQRLGFFESVNIETPQVPGEPDQVDVNIDVTERLSGSLQAGVGYGDAQGALINVSVQEDNFLGTGDRLLLSLNNSQVSSVYSVTYLDRYFTRSGISQQLAASVREVNAENANLADYGTETALLGVNYGIPIAEERTVNFGFSAERMRLKLGSDATSRLEDFVALYGDDYNMFKLTGSWASDSRNSAYFPSRGGRQQIGMEVAVPGSDLTFYKINYSNTRYFSLTENLVLNMEAGLGYGEGYRDTGALPFFENFYAGGISSVRGYRANSLGPVDPEDEDVPIGGNARLLTTVQLIFPVPFADYDSMRLAAFVDGGNVFDTSSEIDLEELRFSAGFGFTWLSPVGALTMSLGRPLNDQAGDRLDTFQFSLGSSF